MNLTEQLLLVLGLSVDGMAVSVCMGMTAASKRRVPMTVLLVTGCHVCMLLLGWVLGAGCRRWLTDAYPWLPAGILAVLGTDMLWERDENKKSPKKTAVSMLMMSLAASVDAMAVGVAFSVSGVGMLSAGTMTAGIMGGLSAVGAKLGRRLGLRWKRKTQLAGGVVLWLMGLRLLLG